MSTRRSDTNTSPFVPVYQLPQCKNFEVNRLVTYHSYKGQNYYARDLADAGFLCSEDGCLLECYSCGLQTQWADWVPGRTPHRVHKELMPRCPIVNEFELPSRAGPNIAIPKSPHAQETGREACHNIDHGLEQMGIDLRPCMYVPPAQAPVVSTYEFCQNYQTCRYIQFCPWQKRKETYTYFPRVLQALEDKLCKCGFFYTGYQDTVICHSCGVRIWEWIPQDDPKSVHSTIQENCFYLNHLVSPVYMDRLQAYYRNIGNAQ